MEEHRKTAAQDLLNQYRLEGDDILKNIATGDKSWVHHYDQENKRQSMEYHQPGSLSVTKFKTVPSAKKVMLAIFWDARGVLYMGFLTGIVQPYYHSSNASTESGWKETRFFCIRTTQGHIAVHKLRMP